MATARARRVASIGLRNFLSVNDAVKEATRIQMDEIGADLSTQQRAANRAFMTAVDHQLFVGCGLTAQLFIAKNPLRRLEDGEERVFKQLVDDDGSEYRRSVIKKTGASSGRWELPIVRHNGRPVVPNTWHTVMDMGTVGDPALNWFFRSANGVGTQVWDILHRRTCDWAAGYTLAGLNINRFEWQSVVTMRKGPFGKQANHSILLGVAKAFFSNTTHESDLFTFFYPMLCTSMGNRDDADYGEANHYKKVWEVVKGHMLNANVAENVKPARWWSLECRGSQMLNEAGSLFGTLLLLVYMGWQRGWWKNFQDTPLFKSNALDEGNFPVHDDDEAPDAWIVASKGMCVL